MVSLGLRGKKIMLDAMLNTSEVAARIASRLGRSSDVQHALRCLFEQWDGIRTQGSSGGCHSDYGSRCARDDLPRGGASN